MADGNFQILLISSLSGLVLRFELKGGLPQEGVDVEVRVLSANDRGQVEKELRSKQRCAPGVPAVVSKRGVDETTDLLRRNRRSERHAPGSRIAGITCKEIKQRCAVASLPHVGNRRGQHGNQPAAHSRIKLHTASLTNNARIMDRPARI